MFETTAEGNNDTNDLITEGVHAAKCIGVYGLGTHEELWGNKQKKLVLVFAVDEQKADGKYKTINQFYFLHLCKNKAKVNLRRDLEKWRGKTFTEDELKAFDTKVLLGKSCALMISIEENSKGDPNHKIDNVLKYDAKYGEIPDISPAADTPDWVIKIQNKSIEAKPKEAPVAAVPVKKAAPKKAETKAVEPEPVEAEVVSEEEVPF